MANESIDDLVSISEQGINVDTEKNYHKEFGTI